MPSTYAMIDGTMITMPRKARDHAQLADEVVDSAQRPREIKRQGVEAQVLADQIRPDQQDEEHGKPQFAVSRK